MRIGILRHISFSNTVLLNPVHLMDVLKCDVIIFSLHLISALLAI
jgi:hypothetical protein